MCRWKTGLLPVLWLCLALGGCGVTKAGNEKIRDLDYTVLEESDIPDELMEKIEEKKEDDFKLSYTLDDYLYIVRGFGMQETGGYSIQVQELYLAKNAIYFDADLIGPKSDETPEKAVSYPFVVIKTERLDENVVFE